MRCLVTGCAGFIGSTLTDYLLGLGYQVIGVDCFTDYYARSIKDQNISDARKNPRFTLIQDEILNIPSFPDVDYIFHEAAQAGVRSSWGRDFSIYTRQNIDSTQCLLEAYKNKSLKKFVFASSSSVYGDVSLPMREDQRLQPISPYGVTKLAAEHLCYLYGKNFNIPTVSLRYFTVYGPRQRPDMAINKFVTAIMEEKPIILFGDGSQTRDFTYVSDIIEANLCAVVKETREPVFNVGGGSRITVNELIKELEKNCGKPAQITYVEPQKGDVQDTLADIQKAKNVMGWKPRISIREGVKRYVEWYLQNNR